MRAISQHENLYCLTHYFPAQCSQVLCYIRVYNVTSNRVVYELDHCYSDFTGQIAHSSACAYVTQKHIHHIENDFHQLFFCVYPQSQTVLTFHE